MLVMTSAWLARGVALGFSIAAPVGPIGIWCLRTSIAHGPRRGLAVGLGAATADAAYGAVAAFGLAAVSALLVRERLWLQAAGGLFLLYLGLRTWRENSAEMPAPAHLLAVAGGPHAPGSGLATYVSAVGLTLTNPMTILSFVAVFAGFGLAAAPGASAAAFLVAGVFLGSALWWVILSFSAGFISRRLGGRGARVISRSAAAVLLAFGGVALVGCLL